MLVAEFLKIRVLSYSCIVQVILDRVMIRTLRLHIMNPILLKDRQCCLSEIFLMPIIIIIIISGGIHGEDLSKEVLHISLGYGLQEITRSILLLNLSVIDALCWTFSISSFYMISFRTYSALCFKMQYFQTIPIFHRSYSLELLHANSFIVHVKALIFLHEKPLLVIIFF